MPLGGGAKHPQKSVPGGGADFCGRTLFNGFIIFQWIHNL
jgi:hypothetical protein